MTTTSKTCAVCGEGGAAATVIITCPDTSAIASTSAAILSAAATGIVPVTASVAGGGTRQTYGNASIPGGIAGLAPPGSSPKQFSVAENGAGAAPARSVDVPVMASSTAASDSLAAALLSGIGSGSTAKLNASVAGPTETFMLKSSNGASSVCFGLGGMCVSFAFLVTMLLS